jgi:hypothetical protein
VFILILLNQLLESSILQESKGVKYKSIENEFNLIGHLCFKKRIKTHKNKSEETYRNDKKKLNFHNLYSI